MKAIILSFIVLLASTQAISSDNGFAECVQAVEKTVTDVTALVQTIKSLDFSQIISEAQAVIADVQTVQAQCKASGYQSVNGLPECIADIEHLIPTIQQTVTDAQAKNFLNLLKDAEALVGEVKSVLADCKVSESMTVNVDTTYTGIFDCVKAVEHAIVDVQAFVETVRNRDFSKIISEAEALIADVQQVEAQCKSSGYQSVKGLPECIADIEHLIPTIQQTVADAQAKNFLNLLKDAEALAGEVKSVLADCRVSQTAENGLPQCVEAVAKAVKDVQGLVTAAKALNFQEIIQDAEAVIADVRTVQAQCLGQLTTINGLPECIADIEHLIPTIQSVVSDVQNKDIGALLRDAEALAGEVESLLNDCKLSFTVSDRVNDLPQCIEAVTQSVRDVQTLVSAVRSFNLEQVISDAEAVLADVRTVQAQCLGQVNNVQGLPECLSDIEHAVPQVEQLVADAKAKNILALLKDVELLVSTVKSALADCKL